MRTADVVKFIKAREKERLRKLGRARGPGDEIIQKYRFCNVRRNDDRVTLWIQEEFFARWRHEPDLWFALVVARLFNFPDSLEEIMDTVLPFKPELMRKKLHFRRDRGLKNFNAAYIVSTNGRSMDKVDYLVRMVLQPLWAIRHNITVALRGATLAEAHDLLTRQNGLGSFMAAQVLADLKYADPGIWADFFVFAASGPGSKRGMNYVLGRDPDKGLSEAQFRHHLADLHDRVNRALKWEEPLTAQDLQNCLCEFSKYERTRLGTGVPKQLYFPAAQRSEATGRLRDSELEDG